MKLKLRGAKVPHKKNTARMAAVRIPTPDTVVIPMSMGIGAPSRLTVKVGDRVKIGQCIAEAGGRVGADIHASVSGTVKKLTELVLSNGGVTEAVIIESDGKNEIYEGIEPPVITDRDSFIEAVRKSGAVGLGGAGFPTSVKLDVDPERVECIILNGAECEPYITSDTRTMIEKCDLIVRGCETISKYLGGPKIYIGIEENKPCAISSVKTASHGKNIDVKELPSLYPQGGEKVLIYNITGKTVPEGGLPIDVGVIVINVSTVAEVQKYIETGMPLVERCVTVDGEAVKEPKNVTVPIGTKISDIIKFCGGFKGKPEKLVSGGLMMGTCLYTEESPVTKSMNAVLALSERECRLPKTTACIRCGTCIAHCPLKLSPIEIAEALGQNDASALSALKVNLCMECGCCSFVCPAQRPLTSYNKLAKAFLKENSVREGEMKK